jgi:hypothetical protein
VVNNGATKMTAKFSANDLQYDVNYDIIDAESGNWICQGMQGCDVLAQNDWPVGAEAWSAGESDFRGFPIGIAE